MNTEREIMDFCSENDVRFIKLSFCDIFGHQKIMAIIPDELPRALRGGVSFDASAISGFGDITHSDLFLKPDLSSVAVLPWRSSNGRAARLFCETAYPDGTPFEGDSRVILRAAAKRLADSGFAMGFGAECEFYLFKTDDRGEPTRQPLDRAGYFDAYPLDRGEDVRREICYSLEEMGILPESSHHEEGPGQNEIDFRYSDPLTCADNVTSFKSAVSAVAAMNGLWADFSPKPLRDKSGSGLHINMSIHSVGSTMDPALESCFMAGILRRVAEMTAVLNPCEDSYLRFGGYKAPRYITWSRENRSQLIRIPAVADGENSRIELRSPDCLANPYLAFALLIHAGLDGIEAGLQPPESNDRNIYDIKSGETDGLESLPVDLNAALKLFSESEFIAEHLPKRVVDNYLQRS